MNTLSEQIKASARFARSANLERDITALAPLDGYIVTTRALDIVERIAVKASSTTAGGAWSITGPYGSGKSSLAVLLDGAFGASGEVRDKALALICEVAPDIAQIVVDAHEKHSTATCGFHRAVVTANREPIGHTVLRALYSAVLRRFAKIPSRAKFPAAASLKAALSDAASGDPRRTGPSPAALLEVARCLAAEAPLLIVVDEFGKNLEAIDQSAGTDPYLLQQLAEAGQGAGARIFTLTLQHLSFEDYFVGSDGPQQREWAKVQGRFEDIAYVDSPAQTRALIGTVFDATRALRERVKAWAARAAEDMAQVGIKDLTSPETVAACYPLHPLAAAVLPELCSRHGQNERTLFSFLTGPGPAAVPAFLAKAELPSKGALPVVGLAQIYDYFAAGGVVTRTPGPNSSRWTEITTRLRDAHGLSAAQSELAKSVAVLNLVSASGTLRASKPLLRLLHPRPAPVLESLEQLSLITYRDFADEYRIWQGSNIDLRDLIEIAARRIAKQSLVDVLASIEVPEPVVAARHSAQNNILRIFSRRYATGDEPVEALSPFCEVDGEVLLVVGAARNCPDAPIASGPAKPVLAAIPQDISTLDTAARAVAAIRTVLDQTDVFDDWVARSELGEQLAQAETLFRSSLVATFAAENCDWFLLTDQGPRTLPSGRGSAALSAAADIAYPDTPIIGNDMINRTAVTSQGARARRLLLEGMLERVGDPGLGFKGYGPEVAMYRSVLGRTRMHRADDRNDTMVFAAPEAPSLQPAWRALETEFKRARTRRINLSDIYAVLMSPPIGMKAAVVPVFVTAGLLAYVDEVAIYEHGTFKPILGADVSERMVRNPGHFDIKHFANADGGRREVIDALAAELGVAKRFRKHRVSNVLAIVGHLVGTVGRLDNYTLGTNNLSDKTLAARQALITAVEPDELLFGRLPEVLGFPPVEATGSYPKTNLLARAVSRALGELATSLDGLHQELLEDLLRVAGETSRLAVTGQAAALADEVLDPDVRAFVLTVANDAVESDADWITAIATVLAKKAVAEWTDEDRARFGAQLPVKIGAFHRLMALHADRRARGSGRFEPMRVTFTRPDGREDYRLVVIDDEERQAAMTALRGALSELESFMGSATKAQRALLALLGEQILPAVSPGGDTDVIDLTPRTAKHG